MPVARKELPPVFVTAAGTGRDGTSNAKITTGDHCAQARPEADRQPAEFGVHGDSVPESFLGQMLYPFERSLQSK
jgi:hypothetical protein